MTTQHAQISRIADVNTRFKQASPLCVGVDGIDAAGKTTLADALAQHLVERGCHVIRASMDGFHNPRHQRNRAGEHPAKGYYEDSFNLPLLKQALLHPLNPQGNRLYRTVAFDYKTDQAVQTSPQKAADDSILIFDGVFLLRPQLIEYWDLKIFIDISFETCLQRALERDQAYFGSADSVIERYQQRYMPAQQAYLAAANPHTHADIVINNNDWQNPQIISWVKGLPDAST